MRQDTRWGWRTTLRRARLRMANPDETMSVMDYPHPRVTLDANGVPDVSHAYPVGIGVWDKVAIDYGYREFDRGGAPVEDAAGLERILSTAEKAGLVYITDEDARAVWECAPEGAPVGQRHGRGERTGPHPDRAAGGAGAVWGGCDSQRDGRGAAGRHTGAAVPVAPVPGGGGDERDWRFGPTGTRCAGTGRQGLRW